MAFSDELKQKFNVQSNSFSGSLKRKFGFSSNSFSDSLKNKFGISQEEKPRGVVRTVLERVPSFIAEETGSFLEREQERIQRQTLGERAVTELVERPAKIAQTTAFGITNFARMIAGGLSEAGKTIQEFIATPIIGSEKAQKLARGTEQQRALEKAVFGFETNSFADMTEGINSFLQENPQATETEKKLLPVVAPIVAFALELSPFGRARKPAQELFKKLAKETDFQKIFKEIDPLITGTKQEKEEIAKQLVRLTDEKDVESVFRSIDTPKDARIGSREIGNAAQEEFERAESEVFIELDIAEAGQRLFSETGEGFMGVSRSTFPKFISEDLRSRKLFDSVIKKFNEGQRVVGLRETRLANEIQEEILRRMDVEIRDELALTRFASELEGRAARETDIFLKKITEDIAEKIRNKTFTLKQFVAGVERAEARGKRIGVEEFKRQQRELSRVQEELRKEVEKPKARQRSTAAFVRALGEFSQGVVNEIKRELGIAKPIQKMNLEELQSLVTKLKERLKFKFERGFKPSAETTQKLRLTDRGTSKPEFDETFYQNARQTIKATKASKLQATGTALSNVGKGIDFLGGSLSTRFGNIAPELKARLRKWRFDTRQIQARDSIPANELVKKTKKMSDEDKIDFRMATLNGDGKKIRELAKKYDFEKELENIRNTLNEIYKRANEVGFDVGYLTDYFPRTIKDIDGLIDFVGRTDEWGFISEAIQRKETDIGRWLTADEKAHMINTLIRGYQTSQITLSKTGAMKNRLINNVTPEMVRFYDDWEDSLLKYVTVLNEKIEAARLFGKKGSIKDAQGISSQLDHSVGAFLADEIAAGRITAKEELELRGMLQSLLNPKGTTGLIGVFKDLGYIDTLGDFRAAITQLGDIALSLYAGGIKKGATESARSLIGKSRITKEEFGFAAEEIAAEVSRKSGIKKVLDTVLRLTGFRKMDRVGAEGLPNAVIQQMRQRALESDPLLRQELEELFPKRLFPEGTIDDVIEDLAQGRVTENVKYIGFNKILDFSPRDIIELPEQYIKGGNGRIFYMLKSWTLKLFDIYRREVFQQIRSGNKKEGVKNFVRLTTLLVAMNATADEIKDFISGRETSLSDRVVDTFAKLAGFSRYTIFQAEREGLGSAVLQQLLPPTPTIDDVTKDAFDLFKDTDKSFEVNELRSVRSIPIGGDLYYWWFGKGVKTRERQQKSKDVELSFGGAEVPKIKGFKFGGAEVPKLK